MCIMTSPTSFEPDTSTSPLLINDITTRTTTLEQPAFICTICWQHQPSGSKPRLLGSTARIVCHTCWCAVLDLSICWGCGECIVRGNEVVSLGWCFWHRGCFGCLFCKEKMGLPGIGECRQKMETCDGSVDRDGHGGGDLGMGWSVELSEAPVCGGCKDQEGREEQATIHDQRKRTVLGSEEGWSRVSLEVLEERNEDGYVCAAVLTPLPSRRLTAPPDTDIEEDLIKFVNSGSSDSIDASAPVKLRAMTDGALCCHDLETPVATSVLDHAADIDGASVSDEDEDGDEDEDEDDDGNMVDSFHVHSDNEEADFGHQQCLFDLEEDINQEFGHPIIRAAGSLGLKTERIKQTPAWMKYLPNNVRRERGDMEVSRPKSPETLEAMKELQLLTQHMSVPREVIVENKDEDGMDLISKSDIGHSIEMSETDEDEDISNPWSDSPALMSPTTPTGGLVTPPVSIRTTIVKPSPRAVLNATDLVCTRPNKITFCPSCQSAKVAHAQTKPQLTPFPHIGRPLLYRSDTSSYFNHCTVISPVTVHSSVQDFSPSYLDSPFPSPESISSSGDSAADRIYEQLSSCPSPEITSESADSIMSNQASHFVLNPEPILEKIRRQKGERMRKLQSGELDGKDKNKRGSWGRSVKVIGGTDPRRELNQELRSLFRRD